MTFRVSNLKENHFLELLDNKYLSANLTYIKDSSWLKQTSHSFFLCARATRAITNHTSMEEYRLRFFLRENFSYSCRTYPIELRCYIIHEYKRYSSY